MAVPRDRQSAKALVEQIARKHGYVAEEDFQKLEPELRRTFEEALLAKDELIGSMTITYGNPIPSRDIKQSANTPRLAKNLYTSKARFVFELLQNADDNSYTKAASRGSTPYVSFRVHPRQVVVECNEDGFNRENLTAICSVGKSSKMGAQGYIGEKGIGFKSVFMAAWKVHIQSGPFSFSFRHRPGDSGMGMISPIWEDPGESLDLPLTRITLFLHETGDADELARARQAIQEQFKGLQETFLLFMKNLGRVHVAFHDEKGEQTSSATYTIERPRANHAILKRTDVAHGATQEQARRFHVTTHEAANLARNENRTYSEAEEAARAYSKSQVTLAFPLTAASVPITEPQELFVFLPVRPVGFKFLIQADFVTDANRQDIVRDSLRNNGLLDGIADAFAKAVIQFCEHDTLRYQWMRYLPDKKDTNWSTLWFSLVSKIADRLQMTAVLYGRKRPGRRLIRTLLRPPPAFLDESGEPLLDEGDPEQIISRCYHTSDLNILSSYELAFANFWHIAEWLKRDLRQGALSRMKSPETTESWHTRAAKLLHSFKSQQPEMNHLKNMDLLPLEGGIWVSVSSGPVYFPQVNGMDIPSDVHLRLISKSVTNAHRRILFEDLGVQTASVELVREKILEIYEEDELWISLENSKRHLHFLYLTELLVDEVGDYSVIEFHSSNSKLDAAGFMHIADDEPYGPWELLRKTDPGPNPGDGAPGYPWLFVHQEYFRDSPVTPRGEDMTWREWFYAQLGVSRIVRIWGSTALEGKGKYLHEHRPEKFLGALLATNEEYPSAWSPAFVSCLQSKEVLCRGNRRVMLRHSYFPTTELERRVGRFVEQGAFFPWLWLDTETTHDVPPPEWRRLLTCLGVGSPKTDVDFALDMLKYTLDMLKYTLDAFPSTNASASRPRLFELYNHIYSKLQDSDDKAAAQNNIRQVKIARPCYGHADTPHRAVFSSRRCIYIPLEGNRCTWAFPNECVWEAPQEMQTKYALELLYGQCFRLDGPDSSFVPQLLTATLGITGCTWEIYVDELKELQGLDCEDSDIITVIYKALDALRPQIIAISKDRLKQVRPTQRAGRR